MGWGQKKDLNVWDWRKTERVQKWGSETITKTKKDFF